MDYGYDEQLSVDVLWDIDKEPKIPDMDRKLIINVATPGGLISNTQNPHLPNTPEEIAKEIIAGYKAGAAMWHVHVRDEGVFTVESEIYKKTMDLVFKEAPDIITNLCVVGSQEIEDVDVRLKPLIEPLVEYGANYCESGLINCQSMALGPIILRSTGPGNIAEAKYMVEKGVKPELVAYNLACLVNIKEWLIDSQIVPKPYLIDICAGIHNSTPAHPTQEAFSNYINCLRYLPAAREDCVVQTIVGGRNWLPMITLGIMLGVDIVRVGAEDCLHMYPHKDDIITHSADAISKVAAIAKELGREIATPSEAREILGLNQKT